MVEPAWGVYLHLLRAVLGPLHPFALFDHIHHVPARHAWVRVGTYTTDNTIIVVYLHSMLGETSIFFPSNHKLFTKANTTI